MVEGLTLIGFKHSVYTRIVRIALIQMELDATYVETNPFDPEPDPMLVEFTPFGRVPVLRHGAFTLTETAAILRYLDRISGQASLVPQGDQAAAQMAQVIGIIDAYGYQPMVREVFSSEYYRPFFGEYPDPKRLAAGLAASEPVLQALNRIAGEGRVLNGQITLADLHLAPMIAYFEMVPAAAAALKRYASLQHWWEGIRLLPALIDTYPFTELPDPPP